MARKPKVNPFKFKVSPALDDFPSINSSQVHPIQGDLKDLSAADAQKLINSIEEFGFFVPIYLWYNPADKKAYSLDGHQRCRVINEAWPGGKHLPFVPIEAASEEEALKRLIVIDADYGKITKDGFDSFVARITDGEWFVEKYGTQKEWIDLTMHDSSPYDAPGIPSAGNDPASAADTTGGADTPKEVQPKSGFMLEVICESEEDQQSTYNELIEMGLEVRVVTI